MRSTKQTVSESNGLLLCKVSQHDQHGKVISVSYQVEDLKGNILGCFETLELAQGFMAKYNPEHPAPNLRK